MERTGIDGIPPPAHGIDAVTNQSNRNRPTNLLLAALARQDVERLRPQPVELKRGAILYDSGDPVDHVYFPHGCVVSLVSIMQEGGAVDTAMIGREGAVGIVAALGARRAFNRGFVQVPGRADRVEAARLQSAVEESRAIRGLIDRYTDAFTAQVLQSAACNALHPVEARLCRHLLMSRERAGSDTLPLTHEFVADMLGVNRSTVTLVARTLQAAGLIRYRRGRIEILDARALQEASCECYDLVRRYYEQVLPGAPP